jgi:hypothetical protein
MLSYGSRSMISGVLCKIAVAFLNLYVSSSQNQIPVCGSFVNCVRFIGLCNCGLCLKFSTQVNLQFCNCGL